MLSHVKIKMTFPSSYLQDMENKMRQTLNEIYFGKTKDIVNDLRQVSFFTIFNDLYCIDQSINRLT